MSEAGGHAGRSHALLSASSAKIWLTCPPSARLAEQFPDQDTRYSREGTLAHEIAELKLRRAYVEPMSTRTFNAQLKKLQQHELYDPEMLRFTDVYTDYVARIVHGFTSPPYVGIEKRLDFSAWAPDGFGTGDCIIIGGKILHVCDLKYGKGVPVSAIGNPQMRLYALGVIAAYSMLFPIERVRMTIIQPRLDVISEDEMSIKELLAWGETIKPNAQLAYAGQGDYAPGEHCRFCKAKAVCRARTDHHTALEDFSLMRPPLISNEEVGSLIERGRTLAAWVSDLESYALQECLAGRDIPGWKAVEGRSTRAYADVDAAFAHLIQEGVEEPLLYKRQPLSVAELETLLGKKRYTELLDTHGHVKRPPGRPTLALADDKREAITRQTAQDDFAS